MKYSRPNIINLSTDKKAVTLPFNIYIFFTMKKKRYQQKYDNTYDTLSHDILWEVDAIVGYYTYMY